MAALLSMQALALPGAIGIGTDLLAFYVPVLAGLLGGWRIGLALGASSYAIAALTYALQARFDAWTLRSLLAIDVRDLLPSPPFARVPWPVAGRSRPGDAGLRSLPAPQAVGVASSASTKRA